MLICEYCNFDIYRYYCNFEYANIAILIFTNITILIFTDITIQTWVFQYNYILRLSIELLFVYIYAREASA